MKRTEDVERDAVAIDASELGLERPVLTAERPPFVNPANPDTFSSRVEQSNFSSQAEDQFAAEITDEEAA